MTIRNFITMDNHRHGLYVNGPYLYDAGLNIMCQTRPAR